MRGDGFTAGGYIQGECMNSTDLAAMFAAYVRGYEPGVDDKVTKWVGNHTENSNGVEAELDIQYIMGVTPGIQTEFWAGLRSQGGSRGVFFFTPLGIFLPPSIRFQILIWRSPTVFTIF